MRIPATAVEEALRAVLAELGLAIGPLALEITSEGVDPLLGEDRDATHPAGIAVFLVQPEHPKTTDQYLLKPGPDGMVETADVDQDLRAIRQAKVAGLAWQRLAVLLNMTVDDLLTFED